MIEVISFIFITTLFIVLIYRKDHFYFNEKYVMKYESQSLCLSVIISVNSFLLLSINYLLQ